MPNVIFIAQDDTETNITAESGQSLMQIAVDNDIEGITAECGGACACATCHIYIDSQWKELAGSPDENEATMLEYTEGYNENSRLGCQVTLTDEMDGIRVIIAEN